MALGSATTDASGCASLLYNAPAGMALGGHTMVATFGGDATYLANGAGTSVGTAPSLPLAPFYNDLARIVATIPDEPGSFNHPRVRAAGAYFPGVERPWETFTLVDLAHRFRAWVAEREGT